MSRGRKGAGRPNEAPLPEPIAYFLTWTTYGTWLPGDERGWAQKGRGWQCPDSIRKREALARMTADACILDREQRQIVEKAVADHCLIRCWDLFAVNCRSNHVHVVVGGNCTPDDMRKQFKAWCTVRLKELEKVRRGTPGQATVRTNWWTERGSGLFINNEEDLETVFQYVRDAQDHPAK